MRTLEFKVLGQQLKRKETCSFSNIIKGSSGYLQMKFYFASNSWSGCKKTAIFAAGGEEYRVVLDSEDSCIVPKKACDQDVFFVSLSGIRKNTDYRIVTDKFKIKQG